MFTRSLNQKIIYLTSHVIKASSLLSSKKPVHRLSFFDIKNVYVQNAEFRRLFTQEAKSGPMIADYAYVKKVTADTNILLIDVREPDEVKENGKIPNSINIPLGSVSSVLGSMTEKEFQQTYNRIKPNTETEIIFYCMIGKRSGKAQQNAINLGFKKTKNYLGSWTDWKTKDNKN